MWEGRLRDQRAKGSVVVIEIMFAYIPVRIRSVLCLVCVLISAVHVTFVSSAKGLLLQYSVVLLL